MAKNRFYGFTIHRTICDVLTEMRAFDAKRNYSGFMSLVEEIQSMANRMEAKLYQYAECGEADEYTTRLKKEVKELEAKLEQLRKQHKASNIRGTSETT